MKKEIVILCICLLIFLPVLAIELPQSKIVVSIEGLTPITDSLYVKTSLEKNVIITESLDKELIKEVYPLEILPIENTKTDIIITNYYCDKEKGFCGYWIIATRYGQAVTVNNPIWIVNPPIFIIKSDITDAKIDTRYLTIEENPKEETYRILLQYADSQPLNEEKL